MPFEAVLTAAQLRPAPESLKQTLSDVLGDKARRVSLALGEVTVLVARKDYLDVAVTLRDHPACRFEQLIDLCGVDFSDYKAGQHEGPRFAVVSHLLSVSLNQRVRLKVFCDDDDFPVLPSLTEVWNSANWFEREAFDLFGLPTTGHVEMRYDPEQKRVIYQPVSIELREITTRIIREEGYAGRPLGSRD
jgi:NADH-quinone oxidoreductase subunit C